MAGELRNYNPREVTATFTIRGGASIDMTQGLVDADGAIAETKATPGRFSAPRVDRQGNGVRNKISNQSGGVVFNYVAESPIHDILSGLMITDDETGAVVGDLVIRDLNGTTIMTYLGAYIQDDPPFNAGATMGDRAYTMAYVERKPFLGGATVV